MSAAAGVKNVQVGVALWFVCRIVLGFAYFSQDANKKFI